MSFRRNFVDLVHRIDKILPECENSLVDSLSLESLNLGIT